MKDAKKTNLIILISFLLIFLSNTYSYTNIYLNIPFMNTILTYGGILGTSLAFIITGYKIYLELYNLDESNYSKYLKKIFSKDALIYYVSLVLLLILTNKAAYLSQDNLDILVSHLFLYNNLYVEYAGAINGAIWFLGTIVQFILIAPLIYEFFKKFPRLTLFLSLLLTFSIKAFIYHFIFNTVPNLDDNYYFIYAFQVFTAGFLFIIGMVIAKYLMKGKKYNNFLLIFIALISCLAIYALCKIATLGSISFFSSTEPFKDNVFSYFWLHVLGIFLGFFAFVGIYYSGKIQDKKLNSISKYIFSIYIWHLVIISNLYSNSPTINGLSKYPIILYILLLGVCIAFGIVFEKIFDKIDIFSILKNKKLFLKKIVILLGVILSSYCLLKTYQILKPMINNYQTFKNNEVKDNNPSKVIASHAEQIMTDKTSCKYIYIDGENTGYLYFYQLRYYLSPCETIHFNTYSPIINYKNINDIYEYLKDVNVKYYIIKENDEIAKALNTSFDSVNGSIYMKNDNSKNIKDLFIPLKGSSD